MGVMVQVTLTDFNDDCLSEEIRIINKHRKKPRQRKDTEYVGKNIRINQILSEYYKNKLKQVKTKKEAKDDK